MAAPTVTTIPVASFLQLHPPSGNSDQVAGPSGVKQNAHDVSHLGQFSYVTGSTTNKADVHYCEQDNAVNFDQNPV